MEKVMWYVVSKLNRMRKWGGAHTELKNLKKGLPMHYRTSNKGKKTIEKALKELINKNFLLVKPSTGEFHVSLNPRKAKEIKELIQKYR